MALEDYPFFCLGLRPLEVESLLSAEVLRSSLRSITTTYEPCRVNWHRSSILTPRCTSQDILVVDRMRWRMHASPFSTTMIGCRMPSTLKVRRTVRGYHTKYLLKKAFHDLLPPLTRQRRKHGFTLPVDHWFRHELRDMVHDLLAPSQLQAIGLFEPRAVSRLVQEHVSEGRNHKETLWALVVFMLWHQHQGQWPVARASSSSWVGR